MKNAEKTRAMILDVATQLFLSKGYEQTRLSDIIKGLDGLTKGAVYHYFDSKEAIFNEVVKTIGLQNKVIFDQVKLATDMTGAEKLAKLVSLGMNNDNMETITSMSPKLLDSPKLLAAFLKQTQEISIPEYFSPVITEGVEDGSIKTEHPAELAELIAVLFNIWCNPLMFPNSTEITRAKLKLINTCLKEFDISFPMKEE